MKFDSPGIVSYNVFMKTDYPLFGRIVKLEIEIEEDTSNKLSAMASFTGFSKSELTNTALKRFIATHKDFLPDSSEHKVTA